ncbi:hypothetical protein TSAR_000170 [Trichomalopsis sarcophagae]|uniref:Tonsoku-like protein n=1 Tax=Trichomalopsis sarcophagae TaxID=543379 RepID=A0A232F2C8_9HYME|nr:hypothetical protein TSAR_000170 [Trichomalopsis sarcophagae]
MDEDSLLKRKNKAQKEGNGKVLADVQKKLGDLYYDRKQYEDALKAYKGQLQACECLNDKLNCAIAHRMIGEVYADIGNFNEALNHQSLYLEIAKELQDLTEEQRAFATLGRTYLLVADSLVKDSETNKKMEVLRDAKKAFSKSIKLCDKLENKIDVTELMMMRARLLLNLGLVLEQQKDTEQALNLIKQAAGLCRKHNLHEDLHRTNIALAGLNERLGNTELALKKLDDAAKVDDIYLKVDARLLKAELLLKLGEWMEAQKLLHTLYKSKKLLEPIRQQVIKLLKIAVVLCKTEDKLLTESSPALKEKFYEKMGDAATAVKSLDKAVEYYRCMLSCAEESNSSQLGAALTSLAQTLRDAGKLQEAIPYARRELELCKDPKEACSSALYLAGLLTEANCSSPEVRQMFERALSHGKKVGPGLERTVLREFIEYLEKMEDVDLAEITRLNEELESLPKEEDDDDEEEENTPDIGVDVCLEELSDLEEEVPAVALPARNIARHVNRKGRFCIKKNEKGETQLHVACIKGNISAVEKLLEEGHPTAVRDNCGWTPLHEASNHGFVDIVGVLIRHGADVNDPGGAMSDGVTALHDASANGHTAVIQLLLNSGADANLLTKTGDTALDCLEQWRQRVGDLTPTELKEYVVAKRRLQAMTTVTGKKKKKKDLENRGWDALVDDEEEGGTTPERGKTIEDYAKREKISAGEDYKRTIAALHHPGRQQLKVQSKKMSRITAPLLDSEDMLVNDDWLEDDLGIAASKHKDKAPSYFANNGLPPPTACETNLGSTKRKSKNDVDEDDAIFEVDKNMKRQKISVERELVKKAPVIAMDEDSCDSDKTVDDWPKQKKPRQMSLLKQGFTKNVCSRSPSPTLLISPDSVFTPAVHQERHSWDSGCISETVDLDIVVDSESFELKLHLRDLRKTMSDIEELIKHKFEAKTGCRPKIKFKTVDGIVLADQVSLVEVPRDRNKLKLYGEIAQNDLLPIVDRYKKVCETLCADITDSMLKSLRSCDNTSSFRLNRLDAEKSLEPLLKCLRYQSNLRTLNLSGATFFNIGNLLNRAIAQLSRLDELHLQCCDLDFKCLSCIEALPISIRVLDLSYNPLTGRCQKILYELLKPLERLQNLALRYCELDDFRFVVTSGSLVNLDLSWNPIGGQGVANMLQRQLLSLNISNTQNFIGGRVNVIDKIFFSDSLVSFYTLESLEIGSCQATDLDVEKILSQAPNLTRINVSNNINVTKTSLCAILQRNPTMTYINLTGCRLVEEPPEANLKITSPQVCTLLVHMRHDVIDAWENLWQRKGYSKKLPHSLVMFKPI